VDMRKHALCAVHIGKAHRSGKRTRWQRELGKAEQSEGSVMTRISFGRRDDALNLLDPPALWLARRQ